MLVVISNKTHFWLAEESTKWKYFNIVSGIDTTQCSTYCPVTTLKTEVGLLSQANLKSHWFRLPSVPSRSTRTWRSWKLFLKESIASSKKKTHFTSCPWAEQRCCGKGVTSPDTESFRSQVEISTLKIRPHFSLNSFKFFEVSEASAFSKEHKHQTPKLSRLVIALKAPLAQLLQCYICSAPRILDSFLYFCLASSYIECTW